MDFELSDDQKLLASTVGDFAKKESPLERARKLRDDEVGWDEAVWSQMGELGWLAVPFPEAVGGFDGSFVECALILEQLAKTLVPEPYLASVVLGGMAVLHGASEEQAKRWLEPMVEGKTSLALAWAERAGRYDVSAVETRAEKKGDGYELTGEKVWVLNGHAADQLIVSARTTAGVSLFAVDREGEGVNITPVQLIDGRRGALVRFEAAKVDADRLLGKDGAAVPALERALDYGAAACVAEGVGVSDTMLWMTVEYLNTREQFGKKIGTFQALQHAAVDMFVEAQLLTSMNTAAMIRACEDSTERASTVSAAKHQLSVTGKLVSQQSIQLHGGVGVTDEHDVGLYFKRMHVLMTMCGDDDFHTERFVSDPAFTEEATA